jgi:predicted DNA-binding antitoxin AbrB/MazE fold protein
MEQRIRAVYRVGAFVPQETCDFPDGAQVELVVEGPMVLPPEVTSLRDRSRLLKKVAKRMRQNPIPIAVTHLTREELHERR